MTLAFVMPGLDEAASEKAIAELDELDVISSNVIQDHVQQLEKFQWFMRSHLA